MKNEKKTIKDINGLRNKSNFKKRYDWVAVQKYYDDGNSWRDVQVEFGMSSEALAKAIRRGDFITRSMSESGKLAHKKYGSPKMGVAARARLSIEQSIKNRGGKCKWFMVAGQSVQGTWERALALKMEELQIDWKKLSIGKDVWPYVNEGVLKNYTPDFYLPKQNLYLDPKGHWWGSDREKINLVKMQHTDKKLIIIEKELYKKLISSRTLKEFEMLLVSQLS